MPIDLVYLWVNGNDPVWIAKHNKVIGKTEKDSAVNCEGRYADNNELLYSLRSAELYAPWIRRIFIVTDDQVPEWLDTTNPKIRIVDHKEILPPEALPCFNSTVLEHFIPQIPDLAERFLFANDDTYFNQPVKPSDFFAADGLPYVRVNRRPLRKLQLKLKEKLLHKKISHYNQIVQNAAKVVEKECGKYFGAKSHHNIDAYLKSDFLHTFQKYYEYLKPTFANHVRNSIDIQRSLYTYNAMAEHRVHVLYVSQKVSFRLHIEKQRHYKKLDAYNPMLFCMNDSEYANDADRQRCANYLKHRFPEKSSFEK